MVEDIEEYGKPCLYVAKTRKQAHEIIWEKFERALRHQPDWRLYDSALEAYHKPSGAFVRIKGVDKDADNLAGSGYRIIACDEYALWKKPEVYSRVLAPMLGDYNGQAIFTSTKRGKNHFFKLHQKALSDPNKYFCSEATMFDNTFLSDEGRAKVLSEYEGGEANPLYQQEVLNKYVTFEGQIVAIPEESYLERRWDPGVLDHCYHWRGMDLGFSPDPTACVWIAYDPRREVFQIYSEYEEHALLIKQHAEVIQAQEPYRFNDSISDNDPQVLAEFKEVGLDLTAALKSDKRARVLRFVNAIRIGKLKIALNCGRLRDALQSYTWEMFESGDDPHLIDAARYVYTNLSLPPKEVPKAEEDWPRRSTPTHNRQSFGDEDD
jgi:phage terminase large subunit